MSAAIINIQNLSFAYNGSPVLRDIKLHINEGEYVAVIGPNGAGKSTLLKCLNRIVHIPDGTVTIKGRDLTSYSQKEIGRLVGYVPQIREYSFSYSVYEFVMMGRYPYLSALGRETAQDKRVVNEILELTQLTGLAERRINTLSGGERQKVYLAASLAQQPKILLLDEPTTHLDPKHQIEIQHIICDLSRKYKMTVLHITHDLNHIAAWSHKVMALKDGKLFCSGTPQEVLTPENLSKVFDVRFLFLKNPKTNQSIIVPEDRPQ